MKEVAKRSTKRDWKAAAIITVLAIVIFLPVIYSMVHYYNRYINDYPGYYTFVEHMRETGIPTRPNFLFPLMLFAASVVLPMLSLPALSTGLAVLAFALLAVVINQHLEFTASQWSRVFVAVALIFAAALTLPAIFTQHLYFGFLTGLLFHNASFIWCKPFALAYVMMISAMLTKHACPWKQWMLVSILLVIAGLFKPNALLVIAPALIVLWFMDRTLSGKLILSQLAIVMAMLVWQFLLTYQSGSADIEQGRVIFAPLAAMRAHSGWLLPKFLLSILFPLTLLWLKPECWRSNVAYRLAWIAFGFGAAMSYLFAEEGTRLSHANFQWGGQLGAFLLLTISAIVYINGNWRTMLSDWKHKLLTTLLALHIASGVVFYAADLIHPGEWW